MRYLGVACDFDGTLAKEGRVARATSAALERLAASGRRLILVTGRMLSDALAHLPEAELFDRIVAENGGVLYCPRTQSETPLGDPPAEHFVRELERRNVRPLEVGRVVVATREPHQTTILETIHAQGLELQVIFNKGAVMVLPAGVNKASGLSQALAELCLSPHNVVGIGDAENDHSFLGLCECAVAVSNALPTVKAQADLVTPTSNGAGVRNVIERLLEDDLASVSSPSSRRRVLLGTADDGTDVTLDPFGYSVLIAGPSSSGKSTVVNGFLERLGKQNYQFCLIDPEGDYAGFAGAVTLGDQNRVPTEHEVLQLLEQPAQSAVVDLVGLSLADRPEFLDRLLPQLLELRARCGRPHWLVIDEAHHLLPAERAPGHTLLPAYEKGVMMVTVHPESVSRAVLEHVDVVLAVGSEPGKTLGLFADVVGQAGPRVRAPGVPGHAIRWDRRTNGKPFRLRIELGSADLHRHRRKYAEGQLPPSESFYFHGPHNKLNLRAQNLVLFSQLSQGIDDETWLHHLRRGDYSRWFRKHVKDHELGDVAERVEQDVELKPVDSRKRILTAIEERYTLPA